jgi:electron transport complex protein RnfA
MELFSIFISVVLVNNFIFARFLGLCPYLGVSRKSETALGMGLAVIFVMTLASLVTGLIYNYVLLPLDLVFLKIVVFILVIASLVQFVETFLKKASPALYQALGIYLPLITTNCAILGAVILIVMKEYTLLKGLVFGLGAGIGFTLALVVMAEIRERLEFADIPQPLKGFSITLIIAGLLALAFMGFSGLAKM